jgi:hypothetical protein
MRKIILAFCAMTLLACSGVPDKQPEPAVQELVLREGAVGSPVMLIFFSAHRIYFIVGDLKMTSADFGRQLGLFGIYGDIFGLLQDYKLKRLSITKYGFTEGEGEDWLLTAYILYGYILPGLYVIDEQRDGNCVLYQDFSAAWPRTYTAGADRDFEAGWQRVGAFSDVETAERWLIDMAEKSFPASPSPTD